MYADSRRVSCPNSWAARAEHCRVLCSCMGCNAPLAFPSALIMASFLTSMISKIKIAIGSSHVAHRKAVDIMDIGKLMQNLSRERPIFHSEADFQLALAWHLLLESPKSQIRLEYPLKYEKPAHLDIWLADGSRELAFEVKYKKRRFFTVAQQEVYSLKTDGAEDIGRYDFTKDVQRLEEFVSGRPTARGYAILLTNDSLYWGHSPRQTISDAFRVTEGRTLTGKLAWSAAAGQGTTRGRESPIALHGTYQCSWKQYSGFAPTEYVVGDKKLEVPGTEFRYLCLQIS